MHPRRRRLGQDPGPHPPHRPPGRHRVRRPPPRARPHLHPQGGRGAGGPPGGARAAGPAHGGHVPRRRAGPSCRAGRGPGPRAARPARPQGPAARLAPRPHDPHDRPPSSPRRSSGRRPGTVAPDGYARRRPSPTGAPACRPSGSRRCTGVRGREAAAAASSTSTTSSPTAPARSSDDPAFADAQRWRFRHLFVDEFQDVNPLQHHLLTCWLGGRDDLCVVGRPEPGDLPLERRRRLLPATTSRRPTAVGWSSWSTTTARRPRSSASPPPCSTARHAPAHRAPPAGRGPDDRHLPDRHRRGPRHRPRRPRPPRSRRRAGTARPSSCARNGQTRLIEEALGRARIPYRLRGAAPFLTRPAVVEGLATLAGSTGGLAVALAELAAETTRGDDLTDLEREARRPLDALVQLGEEFLALEPAGSVADLRRWLSATVRPDDVPESAATRSRSSRSTRRRASSGRSCTWPGSRTATCR